MSAKRKVLLVGDAVVSSGFARMNHEYAAGLIRAGWDVSILGLNYTGDPYDMKKYPYPIYSCYDFVGGDAFGLNRLPRLVRELRPDLVSVTNDPWNIPVYLKKIGNTPTIGSIAVDGLNCKGAGLNGLAHTVFWTEFGQTQARLGGFVGRSEVIGLGVDTNVYHPYNKVQSRQRLGLKGDVKDAFIVGVVGRNQPRKRLDLAMIYFAEWIRRYKINDAYLFLHVGPTGDVGYDLKQLADWLKISTRIIHYEPEIGMGVPEEVLAQCYSAMDCMMTCTQGEGWGLTHLEGMACGVPQIVPNWAALGEWAEPASIRVHCSSVAATIGGINVIGGIADQQRMMEALQVMYSEPNTRLELIDAGLALANSQKFNFSVIGDQYAKACEVAMEPQRIDVGQEVAS